MKLLQVLKKIYNEGIRLPLIYDPVSSKPSLTLSFGYLSFMLAMWSVVSLHFHPSDLSAALCSMSMWALSTVFYLLRKLTKAKFDATSKSFELDGGDDDDKKT